MILPLGYGLVRAVAVVVVDPFLAQSMPRSLRLSTIPAVGAVVKDEALIAARDNHARHEEPLIDPDRRRRFDLPALGSLRQINGRRPAPRRAQPGWQSGNKFLYRFVAVVRSAPGDRFGEPQ